MNPIIEGLKRHKCFPHRVTACERCIAQQERYAAWWDRFDETPPVLGFDDLEPDERNDITMLGYCKCGHNMKAVNAEHAREFERRHYWCPYRHQIRWITDGQGVLL